MRTIRRRVRSRHSCTSQISLKWLQTTIDRIQSVMSDVPINADDSADSLFDVLNSLPTPSTRLERLVANGLLVELLASVKRLRAKAIVEWFRRDISKTSKKGRAFLAAQYIERHCCDSLASSAVVAYIGCHETTLRREFKHRFGMSMKEYQTHIRILRAMRMLLNGDTKISAIASAVGYSSDKNLYSEFKRVAGVTPATVRRSKDMGQARIMMLSAKMAPKGEHDLTDNPKPG
jgi:AraC-like DNA-binding protein